MNKKVLEKSKKDFVINLVNILQKNYISLESHFDKVIILLLLSLLI